MKKVLLTILTVFTIFSLTACGNKRNMNVPINGNNNIQGGIDSNSNTNKQEIEEDEYIDDNDEIVEHDDEDNVPYVEEKVVVEEVINCDGCVYAYFSEEERFGSSISEGDYTIDINELKTTGGKQRHNFFGLVLDGNTISRAYSCILKNNKIYCIEGSVDGRYHESNIGVLNQIFNSSECKYLSDGHNYWCTDGNYNGNTRTSGYTSLHYETSCTIYGSEARTGTLMCS